MKGIDPQGKRALFETPPVAAPDLLRAGPERRGRDALFSTGPRETGTVVVRCSSCKARSRASLADLGLRMLPLSLWWPGRRHSHWLRCPACERRTWCHVGWLD